MSAEPSADAVDAARGRLDAWGNALLQDARRTYRTAAAALDGHWSGLGAIAARSALSDQYRLIEIAGQAVIDAGASLGPVVAALDGDARVRDAFRRAAAELGMDDPQLARAAAEAVRGGLERARDLVASADLASAERLAELAKLARALAAFPVRPDRVNGVGGFSVAADPEAALLGLGPTLAERARTLAVRGAEPGPAEKALLEPAAVAADLAATPVAREIASAIALERSPRNAAMFARASTPGAVPRRLLYWDPAHGHVAEVVGDLQTADTVVVLVPGTTTSLARWPDVDDAVTTLQDSAATRAPDRRVAVVGWFGSALPPNLAAAALQSYAKNAAPRLAAFIAGLRLAAGVRLTVVGHSYGAVVAGLAVHGGLRPAALVGLGAPGFGPKVRSVRDLGGVPTYVLTHRADPINEVQLAQHGLLAVLGAPVPVLGPRLADRVSGALGIGHLGTDPTRLGGAIRVDVDAGSGRRILPDLEEHSNYLAAGSESLLALADIVDANPRQ